MQLTEQERASLERWHCREGTRNDAYRLAAVLSRLYPVRTYGPWTIRWDHLVTAENLVACGGQKAAPTDPDSTACVVDMGGELWAWFRDESVIWLYKGSTLHELAVPRNMGEVWALMERVPPSQQTQTPNPENR